jgi:hypothetical protein
MGMDDVGQVPFQAPAGLLRGLRLGKLALVVDLTWAGVTDLADGDEVQGGVELAVAAPVQPMATDIAAGASMGAVPVELAKWSRSGKRVRSPAWPSSLAARTGPTP